MKKYKKIQNVTGGDSNSLTRMYSFDVFSYEHNHVFLMRTRLSELFYFLGNTAVTNLEKA